MSAIREIRKYKIESYPGSGDYTSCQWAIPKGSIFLDLQMQDGIPVMWWDCPLDDEPKDWPLITLLVVGTGPPGRVEELIDYLGTFQDEGFVGHVYIWGPTP